MSEDLFCESPLIIWYTLGNKIKAITLVDIYATKFDFINGKFAKIICHILKIQPQCLSKPKSIQGFNRRAAKSVTYTIYPILSIRKHTESLTLLPIIKLGQHPMILGRP